MRIDHELSHRTTVHTDWDASRDPALTIASGEIVRFECLDANGGRITPETTAAALPEFVGHHLTGPVELPEAEQGAVLEIDIIDVDVADWGYTLVRGADHGVGLLPEEFPEPAIFHWELDDGVGTFENGIEVPLDPFPGVLGVPPAVPGAHSTTPPRHVGGNLDVKHLTAGATLWLPVAADGALFSIGDGHAAQGDGEVCVSAIEAPTSVTARLTIRDDRPIETPRFMTPGPFRPAGQESGRAIAATGVEADLMAATKAATRELIERLHTQYDLSRVSAYLLCSVAADLKINQVVNSPNWTVSLYLAEELLE